MMISRAREKLVNAIVYFARNTRKCGKTKLFKLLYLLDFRHFRQTGRSVTGLEYRAWPHGPVPLQLVQEWDEFESRTDFDDRYFTKRELALMLELATQHRDELTRPLIGLTHEERGPPGTRSGMAAAEYEAIIAADSVRH